MPVASTTRAQRRVRGSQARAGVVHLETGFSEETRRQLEAMGHTLGPSDHSFGGYQAIMWDEAEGVYYGASEVRKDGHAAGY